ncbi:MAG: 3-dehydroquinate synthase [Bacteroidales bacterium]|nr:3-dehydroquinate synthase [Bacteroidales bacterium]
MASPRLILPEGRLSPLARLNRYLKSSAFAQSRFFIFVDEHTYSHCLSQTVAQVESLQDAEFIEFPVGEEFKSAEVAIQVWQSLMESGADRQSVVVNLGGGCVSDVGAFVASTYMRGLRYVNIPTTLIGMVDAAIGGKTALNLAGVKNVVGTFHMPSAVCVEPSFLTSLPEADVRAGCVELLKTLVVGGAIDEMPSTGWKRLLTVDNISTALRIKASVVSRDPFDRDVRHILNFGHTFGHAIESYSLAQQRPLAHGFAVGVGMLCALYLSVRKLGLSQRHYDCFHSWISELMPLPHFSLRDAESILQLMHHDKKNADGNLLCVLLQDMGAPAVDVPVDDMEVRDALLAAVK